MVLAGLVYYLATLRERKTRLNMIALSKGGHKHVDSFDGQVRPTIRWVHNSEETRLGHSLLFDAPGTLHAARGLASTTRQRPI